MSNDVRLVDADLKIFFEEDHGQKEFLKEYNLLSELDDDPMGQWIKRIKTKGETNEGDQVLLALIIELHRKVDFLTSYVKNEKTTHLDLDHVTDIVSIGFDYFKIQDNKFKNNKLYYGRIVMPIFPKREIAIYFKALDENLAQIISIHERDRNDWSAYMMARERIIIREMKVRKK